jgi:hypothetical protein
LRAHPEEWHLIPHLLFVVVGIVSEWHLEIAHAARVQGRREWHHAHVRHEVLLVAKLVVVAHWIRFGFSFFIMGFYSNWQKIF